MHDVKHGASHDMTLAAYIDDIATIEAQIALCKAAIDKMGLKARADVASSDVVVLLHEWLHQFVGEWRLRHPDIRITLSLPSNSISIRDTRAIGQILLTLLDNAAQSTTDADAVIGISLIVERHAAVIQISDEGRGISSALLPTLGHKPVQSASGGQGIGLLLAFATARQIGATITLSPRLPRGTMASLMLSPT